jgi:hypothetical protein
MLSRFLIVHSLLRIGNGGARDRRLHAHRSGVSLATKLGVPSTRLDIQPDSEVGRFASSEKVPLGRKHEVH